MSDEDAIHCRVTTAASVVELLVTYGGSLGERYSICLSPALSDGLDARGQAG